VIELMKAKILWLEVEAETIEEMLQAGLGAVFLILLFIGGLDRLGTDYSSPLMIIAIIALPFASACVRVAISRLDSDFGRRPE
jgi:hypothetical protein